MRRIYIATFIILTLAVQSAGWCKEAPGWIKLAKSEGVVNSEGTSVAVTLLEENLKVHRPPKRIGNTGFLENYRKRKLSIVVMPAEQNKKRKAFDIPFPSETIIGDPCSIRQLDSLAVENQMIRVSIHYEYACGSGSGGNAEFQISLMGLVPRITFFDLSYASRDRGTQTSVNYLNGTIRYFMDLHEEETANAPKVEPISVGPQPLRKSSFLKCPLPFAPQALPNCVVGMKSLTRL